MTLGNSLDQWQTHKPAVQPYCEAGPADFPIKAPDQLHLDQVIFGIKGRLKQIWIVDDCGGFVQLGSSHSAMGAGGLRAVSDPRQLVIHHQMFFF